MSDDLDTFSTDEVTEVTNSSLPGSLLLEGLDFLPEIQVADKYWRHDCATKEKKKVLSFSNSPALISCSVSLHFLFLALDWLHCLGSEGSLALLCLGCSRSFTSDTRPWPHQANRRQRAEPLAPSSWLLLHPESAAAPRRVSEKLLLLREPLTEQVWKF